MSDRIERSRLELARIARIAALPQEALIRELPNGWTVAATLAHMAHWDGWVVARWDLYRRLPGFENIPEWHADLTNAAGRPIWLAVPPERAARLAVAAAEEVCRVVDALDPTAVENALSSGRMAMLDRTVHWREHLDEVEATLGRGGSHPNG